jgi:hypothetical protein
LLQPHYSNGSEKPEFINIAIVDHPKQLTSEVIDELVAKAMEVAFYSSFTGMVDLQQHEMQQESQKQYKPEPIGFRRYESTQKVQ